MSKPTTAQSSPLATLFPGYFLLVMATGIVSTAAYLIGLEFIAQLMLWLNCAIYCVLWILSIARFVMYRSRVMDDLTNHARGVLFLTLVAGTCILGSQVAIMTPWKPVASALWIIGLALWLVLIYTFFVVVTVRDPNPAFENTINGAWLLIVVSTESISVLGALVNGMFGDAKIVLLISLVLFLIGVLLYIPFITLILYRWIFLRMHADNLTPPYWINMGALAISALAGARLILVADSWNLLQEIAPFLKGLILLYWSLATWWIPLLIVLGIWRHFIARVPLRYEPQSWSVIFPLGIYTVATHVLIQATGLTMLSALPIIFGFGVLSAWLITFVGMLAHFARQMLRPITERNRASSV